MKVVQILPDLDSGGVEKGTIELNRYLVKKGHQSIIIANHGRLVEQAEKDGARFINWPVGKKHPKTFLYVSKLRKLFQQEKPDVIHIRSRLPGWMAYLAWRKLPKNDRPLLVSTLHGLNTPGHYSSIMLRGEKVIAVSEAGKEFAFKHYDFLKEMTVIPRGIEPEIYPYGFQPSGEWTAQWEKDFPETVGKKLIVLPGRLTRLKGHHDFFKIIKNLVDENPHYHGVIAGGSHPKKLDYFEEIKHAVIEQGLDRHISFTGHRSDLREILAHCDISLSLSNKPESFGRTTLEALAMGKPVIAYSHGGVKEQLEALFPYGEVELGDTKGIAEKILKLKGQRPSQENPFTLDNMLSKTLELYEKSLTERKNRDR